MRATFRGCIHLYTGRSVDQSLVLKQEPKKWGWQINAGGVHCRRSAAFHYVVGLLGSLGAFNVFSF